MSALQEQVGGDHYKNLVMQPVEFLQMNRWDYCAGSTLKYLTRYQWKNGAQDLEKAKHFIFLRDEIGSSAPPARNYWTMDWYLHQNRAVLTNPVLISTLRDLEDYVLTPGDDRCRESVLGGIDALLAELGPTV